MIFHPFNIGLLDDEICAIKYSSTNLESTADRWENCTGFLLPEGSTVIQNGSEGFIPIWEKSNSRIWD